MTKPWTPIRITKYSLVYFVLLFCLVFVILALRPITTLHMSHCISTSGIVQSIIAHEGSKDINIRIDDEGRYYINRGLELKPIMSIFLICLSLKKSLFII